AFHPGAAPQPTRAPWKLSWLKTSRAPMEQLILHLFGDFVTQSDWMAVNKSKRTWPALCHVTLYSVPFFLIGSAREVAVIFVSHFIIDRFRLIRYLIWTKNWMGPEGYAPWRECTETGFVKTCP